MTVADTLYDAANDIRGYVREDGLECYGELAGEVKDVVARMDELRRKIDGLGAEPPPYSEDPRIIRVLEKHEGKR